MLIFFIQVIFSDMWSIDFKPTKEGENIILILLSQ